MYQPHSHHLLILSITISIVLSSFFCSGFHDEQPYHNCKQTFKCGSPTVVGELKFPFWGVNRPNYCGKPGFQIKCINNTPIIRNSSYNLQVIGTDPQDNKVTVSMADFSHSICPPAVLSRKLTNASFLEVASGSLYIDSNNTYSLLTLLYGCPLELGHQLSWSSEDHCSTNASVNARIMLRTTLANLFRN